MKKVYLALVPAFVFVPLLVFGQTTISNGVDQTNQANQVQQDFQPIIVASVSVDNFQYTYDENTRKIKLNFDFTNEGQSIDGVNYTLSIISDNGAEKNYVYNKNLYLVANGIMPQAIEESVPSYIFGNSRIVLDAKSSSGMPLVTRIREGILIKQIGGAIHLDSQSCYLTVSSSTKKYDLTQGVDIDPTEKLFLNCNVINSSKLPYSLLPSIKTYERVVQGPFVEESKLSPVSVKNATSTVKIAVTVPTKPQAYSSVVTIYNGNDLIGEIGFHYVVRGESGTINLVQMDKGSYSANDTALIKILWSPRADVFPGMRAATSTASGSLLGTISMSQNGASCADPVSFSLSKSTEQGIEIRVPINTDCNGFNTRIIVTDPISNKVIADASIDTPRDTSVKVIAGTDWNQYAARVLCVIVFIVLIILMILLIKRKKQQIGSKTLLFLIILVTAFSTVQIARAYTLGALIIVPNYAPFMIYAQGSFEVYNKTSSSQSYKAGDTITITDYETPTWMRCSNGAFISVQSKASVKGPTGSILSEGYLSGNPYYPYWGTSSRTRNVKLNVPGTYTVTVTFKLMDWQIGSISANGGRETSFSKTISVPIPAANASPDLNVYFAGTHNGSVTVSTTTKREYDADIIKSSHDPNIWHITICVGPNSCSYSWATDTFVKITPTAVHLPFFDKWTGSCTGTFPECLIETDPVLSKAVTAYFKDTGGSINFTTDNSEGACNSPRSILLSWDKVSNASYYTLERSDNSSLTPISKIITPGTDTRVSYTDSDTVINGHTYYYELFTDLSSTVPVASSTIRAFVDGCPDPTVILTAVPVEVIASPTATAKLTWESDNTTSCVTSGDWVSPGTVGTTSPSGGVSTGALSSVKQYIYNITCSDAANNQTTDTATVNAIIDTGSLSLTCVPNKTSVLTAGEYVTFTATALPAGGYYYWDGSLQQSVVNSLSKMRAANSPPTFNVKDAGSPQRSATKTCDAVPVGPGGNNNPDKPIVSGMPPCVKPGQPFSITVNSTDQDFDDVYYSVLDEYTGPPATRYPSSTFTKQGANYQINLAALSGLGDHTLDITATDLHGLTSDPYISSPIIVSSLCEDPHQGTGQITLGAYKINDSASASTTILQIRAGKDVWLGWHKKDSGVDLTDYDCGGSVIKSNDNTWSQGVWSGNDFNNQGISTTEKFMKVSSPDIKLPLGRYTYQIVCTKLADPNNPEPDVANPIIRSNTVDVIVTSSSIQEL